MQRDRELNAARRVGHSEKISEKTSEQGDESDLVEQVIDRIVDTKVRGRQVRNPHVYRAEIRKQLATELDVPRLRRIIELHPGAPLEMFAGVALGEPAENLKFYRVPDGALTG